MLHQAAPSCTGRCAHWAAYLRQLARRQRGLHAALRNGTLQCHLHHRQHVGQRVLQPVGGQRQQCERMLSQRWVPPVRQSSHWSVQQGSPSSQVHTAKRAACMSRADPSRTSSKRLLDTRAHSRSQGLPASRPPAPATQTAGAPVHHSSGCKLGKQRTDRRESRARLHGPASNALSSASYTCREPPQFSRTPAAAEGWQAAWHAQQAQQASHAIGGRVAVVAGHSGA